MKRWFNGLTLISATAFFMIAGCNATVSQPWVGEPYRAPAGYSNPAQSTYEPMPSILPSASSSDYEAFNRRSEWDLPPGVESLTSGRPQSESQTSQREVPGKY